MGRTITMNDVNRLGNIRLKDLVGIKGADVAVDILHEAIERDGIRIGCIGKMNTGKTSVLRAILKDLGYFNEKETLDEVIDERDAKFAASKRCRFFTSHALDVNNFIERTKLISGKELIEPCILVTCTDDFEKGIKYISSIDEVTVVDGTNIVNNLVNVHKEKLHKVADISI